MIPELSIVICTYNRPDSLKETLSSLTRQTFKDFEVVIIDGGSTKETQEVIKLFEKKLNLKLYTLISSELAKARDMGWRKSKGEIVSWIDDDVKVSPDWAEEVIKTFKLNSSIGGVSGPTIIPNTLVSKRDVFFFYNKKGVFGIVGKFWNLFFLEGKMYLPGQLTKCGAWTPGSNFKNCLSLKGLLDVDYLEACNMSIKRKLVEEVKGFDLGFKGIAEWSELDLAQRVKKLGFRLVFNPKILVNHNVSKEGAYKRRPQAKLRMKNFYRFYFRHIFKFKVNYIFKFTCYVMFLNFYWVYKTIKTKNLSWLGGIVGSLTGFRDLNKYEIKKN